MSFPMFFSLINNEQLNEDPFAKMKFLRCYCILINEKENYVFANEGQKNPFVLVNVKHPAGEGGG